MERTTVYFKPGTLRKLRARSERTGRRQAEIIRTAVERELTGERESLPYCVGVANIPGPDAVETKRRLRKEWAERAD